MHPLVILWAVVIAVVAVLVWIEHRKRAAVESSEDSPRVRDDSHKLVDGAVYEVDHFVPEHPQPGSSILLIVLKDDGGGLIRIAGNEKRVVCDFTLADQPAFVRAFRAEDGRWMLAPI